jgi:hypothetical protein
VLRAHGRVLVERRGTIDFTAERARLEMVSPSEHAGTWVLLDGDVRWVARPDGRRERCDPAKAGVLVAGAFGLIPFVAAALRGDEHPALDFGATTRSRIFTVLASGYRRPPSSTAPPRSITPAG